MSKIRKLLVASLLTVSMFATTQSALAADNEANSMETAIPLVPFGTNYHTIYDSTDIDWFVWENTSGKTYDGAFFELNCPPGYNYDLYFIKYIASINYTTSGIAIGDNGPGGTDIGHTTPVGPGDKLYLVVSPRTPFDFSPNHQFSVKVTPYPL
ncbi:hypothetical protein [Paenibacillus sp.]|uniref:hypothetical protein n=1 Tax=Paenibacillus sp. TaxID=58172 RepID=UPI0028122FE7|nr:hypothetical protein [Paenibacillus sp.]